jgi:hypothetical protein
MLHHRSVEKIRAEQDKPEPKIEVADALLRETIERLARDCPQSLLGRAARESLEDLRPHVQLGSWQKIGRSGDAANSVRAL